MQVRFRGWFQGGPQNGDGVVPPGHQWGRGCMGRVACFEQAPDGRLRGWSLDGAGGVRVVFNAKFSARLT